MQPILVCAPQLPLFELELDLGLVELGGAIGVAVTNAVAVAISAVSSAARCLAWGNPALGLCRLGLGEEELRAEVEGIVVGLGKALAEVVAVGLKLRDEGA